MAVQWRSVPVTCVILLSAVAALASAYSISVGPRDCMSQDLFDCLIAGAADASTTSSGLQQETSNGDDSNYDEYYSNMLRRFLINGIGRDHDRGQGAVLSSRLRAALSRYAPAAADAESFRQNNRSDRPMRLQQSAQSQADKHLNDLIDQVIANKAQRSTNNNGNGANNNHDDNNGQQPASGQKATRNVQPVVMRLPPRFGRSPMPMRASSVGDDSSGVVEQVRQKAVPQTTTVSSSSSSSSSAPEQAVSTCAA